jgi:hypothetical protein
MLASCDQLGYRYCGFSHQNHVDDDLTTMQPDVAIDRSHLANSNALKTIRQQRTQRLSKLQQSLQQPEVEQHSKVVQQSEVLRHSMTMQQVEVVAHQPLAVQCQRSTCTSARKRKQTLTGVASSISAVYAEGSDDDDDQGALDDADYDAERQSTSQQRRKRKSSSAPRVEGVRSTVANSTSKKADVQTVFPHTESHFLEHPTTLVVCSKCAVVYSNSRSVATMKEYGAWLGDRFKTQKKESLLCDMCGGCMEVQARAGTGHAFGFHCYRCNKHFARSDRLLAHSHHHVAKKAFPCTHCPSTFCRLHRLNEHLREVHAGESSSSS